MTSVPNETVAATMAPKLRLLLVTPWVTSSGGGVAEAVRLLSRALSTRDDIRAEVLSTREKGKHTPLEDWGLVPVISYPYFGPSNYRFSPGLFWHLLRTNADVVHVHGIWSFQCLAALLWSLLSGKPIVVSPHGMLEGWILARSRLLKALVSNLYQNAFLRRAAALHVLTERERGDVAEVAPSTPSFLIPNFVERRSTAGKKPSWWLPEYELKTIYLFLGRIHDKKGWRELCSAWDQLCVADEQFAASSQLVFCGWIDNSKGFEETLRDLGRRHQNIVFIGTQYGSNRDSTLTVADALVLPSRSEGLPMVVLEAWAAGVPVIMTEECNLPIGFEAGAALRIGLTASDIASGLSKFAAMTGEERALLSAAGTALARGEFSAETVSERFNAMYRTCVVGRRSRRAHDNRPHMEDRT